MRLLLPILLLVSAVSFGLGISLPLMRFEKLYFFAETPSLIDVIVGLWQEGEIPLAAVVVIFSIVFPLIKLAVSFISAFSGRNPSGWANALAKWSMMDVLLVAIFVFAAKTSGLANAVSQPGVWFYGLSAFCVAVASGSLGKKIAHK